MDDYLKIRLLHRDGMSVRQIARELGHGRSTVKKALAEGVPPGYQRRLPVASPKLGPFVPIIQQILKEDESAPAKQRHTACRIFLRLRDEHAYGGGYDQVRRWVKKHRQRERETFMALEHLPGERLECDFGHIQVDFPDGRREVPVLLAVWSHSQYAFVMALPNERWESILHGTICALEFFGCVPRELWWDNPKTVAHLVLRGRERQLNPQYAQLASHYCFAPRFCLPRKGQEKSDVERTVFALQRRFATPVPQVKDMDELNRHLLLCCLKERERTVRGRHETIGEMFAQDLAGAVALPDRPFDGCVLHQRQADKYQSVVFEDVRYSVPRTVAFCPVTVKAYPEQVVLVHSGRVVARHGRCRIPGQRVMDPRHFVEVLERKPAYLEKTRLFRELKLPGAFGRLREVLETQHGEREGKRQYLLAMQLLAGHEPEEVAQAIEASLAAGELRAAAIRLRLQGRVDTPETGLAAVMVPVPDLGRFNQLLTA